MKIDDIVELVPEPAHTWMKNFLHEKFIVQAVNKNTIKVLMVSTQANAPWTWTVLTSNFRAINEKNI
jgi:hypothetical protein